MPNRDSILLLLAALLVVHPGPAAAAPLGHGFTYQGQLEQSGVPVEGAVSLRFSLWDAAGSGDPPTGGSMVGGVQVVADAVLSGGIFSVELNGGDEFGPQAFNGSARWLQVEVCTDASCTSTTVLGPRQAITGAPYALGPWQMSGTNLNYLGGKVGIGTTSPAYALHIKTVGPAVILQDDAAASQQAGYVAFWNPTTETGWMGYGTPGSPDMTIANARPSGDIVLWASGEKLRVDAGGNVGIGTSTPASRLEVRGDIRMGPLGEYLAPGSSENLRIIRGKVSAAGNVLFGSGFTATRVSTGVYNITFSPAFPSGQWPVVTASAESNGSVARFAMVNTPSHIVAPIRIVNGSGTAADADFYFIAGGHAMSRASTAGVAVALAIAAAGLAGKVCAQELAWHSLDGGGVAFTEAGGYRLGATIGQPDAGTLAAGTFTLRGGFWTGGQATSVGAVGILPSAIAFRFFPTRPNPVRSSSRIAFDLPRASRVALSLYDVAGRSVHRWDYGELPAGRAERVWSAVDEGGHPLSSGIYFLRLDTGHERGVHKVLVLR